MYSRNEKKTSQAVTVVYTLSVLSKIIFMLMHEARRKMNSGFFTILKIALLLKGL